jgi:hypothetical protein
MKISAMHEWVEREFLPLTLVTPKETISQCIENAFRYWNTHSAYKIMEMYDFVDSSVRIQLSTKFKSVVQIYPATETDWIYKDHPLWTLLGIQLLDNVTSDLILLGETFRNFRVYTGTEFTWKYVRSDDPSVGGYLYVINMPVQCERLCAVGTRQFFSIDDITSQYVLDWLLNYSKALIKQIEGNTLRKSDIIGIKNDGQVLVDEGKEEMKDLKAQLAKDGRWVALARRF